MSISLSDPYPTPRKAKYISEGSTIDTNKNTNVASSLICVTLVFSRVIKKYIQISLFKEIKQ